MKTQTRSLKPVADGISLMPSAISRGEALCEYCAAAPVCSLRSKERITCAGYVTPITFIPPHKGFVREFSTFRLGHAWPKRLEAVGHKRVSLFDTKQKKTFGWAEVQSVVHGTVEEMLEHHAALNHMIIGEGVSEDKATERLTAIVKQIYGPHMLQMDRNACVIYLRRV